MQTNFPDKTKIDKIKLIVCDLDGTLLNSHKKISDESAAYIINLQKQGYRFAIATGRFYYEVEAFIHQLHMKEYEGYVVCVNGLEVYNTKTNEVHKFDCIPQDNANEIMQRAIHYNLTMYVNEDEHFHVLCSSLITAFIRVIKVLLKPFSSILKGKLKYLLNLLNHATFSKNINLKADVPKICFTGRSKNIEKFKNEISDSFPQFHFFYVAKQSVEICSTSVSKQYAIAYVCDQLHLNMDQVIAFGDSGNDEMLLSSVGIGVAMKKAFLSTKAAASYENPYNHSEDGVIRYLSILLDNEKR